MITGEIVKEYLRRFPQAKSKTLALLIYRENPALFTNVESARTLIRHHRGNKGNKAREELTDRSFLKENETSGDPFIKLPEGIKSLDWNIVEILGDNRILGLMDIHIPFYDKQALEISVEEGIKFGANIILLNGDITDHFAQSNWVKDPRQKDYPYEIESAKLFFAWLREKFPKARIIWKLGNHEERYERYLILKAPELLGIPFEMNVTYELDKFGIEIIRDMRPLKFNKLYVIHGHEYKFKIANPVNPARGLFLKAKANALCGHFHVSSNHSGKSIGDKIISTWSVGCLSELHPDYAPLNEFNLGFVKIETSGDEDFRVHNYKIINDRIYNA